MPKYYPYKISEIQTFIKNNYEEMYITWRAMSDRGFYGEKE